VKPSFVVQKFWRDLTSMSTSLGNRFVIRRLMLHLSITSFIARRLKQAQLPLRSSRGSAKADPLYSRA